MTGPHLSAVRTAAVRAALLATVLVAVGYVAIAASVLAIATRDLTAQVDRRLNDAYEHIRRGPAPPPNGFPAPPGRTPFEPFVVWTVQPDGQTTSTMTDIELPADYGDVIGPETITVDGIEIRVRGGPAGDGYVVVGQSMQPVSQAQGTYVLAELLIGPVLLVAVFLGAYAVGNRVAAPIERARQRQLEFTADASHELRTPVSVIEANASLALAQDRTAEWYRSAFERVNRETRRMRRLLDDLLWLARFDAAGGSPHPEPVDLGVLATQAIDRFSSVAEARRLVLSARAESGPQVVSAPAEWLDRLLGVLLDNACKYSPEGGAVTVSLAAEGGRVRLTVDDAGPGIPEEERSRIFDRFRRAAESESGAGLGLAIADAVVRATDGRWGIGSSPSGGASMSVSWPRAPLGDQST